MTFGYRAAVEYVQQRWGQYCSTALKHDRQERMMCEDFQCLDTDMFVLLIGYGEKAYRFGGKRGERLPKNRSVNLILETQEIIIEWYYWK